MKHILEEVHKIEFVLKDFLQQNIYIKIRRIFFILNPYLRLFSLPPHTYPHSYAIHLTKGETLKGIPNSIYNKK